MCCKNPCFSPFFCSLAYWISFKWSYFDTAKAWKYCLRRAMGLNLCKFFFFFKSLLSGHVPRSSGFSPNSLSPHTFNDEKYACTSSPVQINFTIGHILDTILMDSPSCCSVFLSFLLLLLLSLFAPAPIPVLLGHANVSSAHSSSASIKINCDQLNCFPLSAARFNWIENMRSTEFDCVSRAARRLVAALNGWTHTHTSTHTSQPTLTRDGQRRQRTFAKLPINLVDFSENM